MSRYPPPHFEIFTRKDDDGTYSAVIHMSKIPNKRLANLSLGWMKEAMNDQIIKLMGKVAMSEIDGRRGDADDENRN